MKRTSGTYCIAVARNLLTFVTLRVSELMMYLSSGATTEC